MVPGPALPNASAALLLASAMGAPVIALAGQIPSFAIDQGLRHLHEIHDEIGLLRHIVKQGDAYARRSRRPARGAGHRPRDFRCQRAGGAGARDRRVGPAAEAALISPSAHVPPSADPEAIAAAAALLAQVWQPSIVVGAGA